MQTETIAGFRLSPQQEQLWLALRTPDDPAYRAACVISLAGPLDARALRASVDEVVARHEILRTTFHRRAGMKVPFQVVHERLDPTWDEVDLRAVAAPDRAAAVDALFHAAQRRSFDHERGPLFHLVLAALAPELHVLVVALPSLVADAATLENLVAEVRRFYGGAGVDDEPLQYADFSEWRNDLLVPADDDAEEGRAFWRARPHASLGPTSLPFHRRVGASPFDPASVRVAVDGGAAAAIAKAGAPFLLAAWHVLLSRLTGQTDIAIRVILDGRGQEEARSALGLFAEPGPMAARLDGTPHFDGLVSDVGRALEVVARWQDMLPIAAERGGAAFECRGGPEPELGDAAGVRFVRLRQSAQVCGFGVKLSATLGPAPSLELEYDRSAYRDEDIGRAARCLAELLRGAAEKGGAEIAALPLLSDADRRVVASFTRGAAVAIPAKSVHSLFEEQAARTPERPAVVFANETITYAELDARANRLARILRKSGVAPNTRVGLAVERSIDMVVALLAVLKAGGAYVPLLADHPKARVAHQLAEAQVAVLVTQETLLGQLPAFGGETICVDRDRARIDTEDASRLEHRTGPESLAYVIYTSGSTGVPKGVAVTHGNVVNYTRFMCDRLGLDAAAAKGGLHFATVSTIAADLGNTCVFPALLSGGCLHVIGHETSMDRALFADYCAEHAIDVLKITPSHLAALLPPGSDAAVLPRKWLITGGEALSWDLARRVREAGKCALLNHYGPTETTIGSLTYGPILDGDPASGVSATVPIGRPIENTEIHVLDAHLAPVPVGAPGELFIGGAGLSRGYLGQPTQTQERFVPHPSSEDPSARLYRTGDRVRFLDDGSVEFLGRVDHQVKIRGFRVESGEIEAAMQKDPAVRAAIVVVRDDERGDARLIAYFVPARRPGPSVEDLRRALLEHVPDYMVPSIFVRLDALPLTANGKVSRAALPPPDQAGRLDGTFLAPRDAVETKLAGIWGDVLRVARVGVNDNFFELGGHSLLATQVISRVRVDFEVHLSLNDLFDAPTVAGMARAIAGRHDVERAKADRLLADIEAMSEEEAERLLGEHR